MLMNLSRKGWLATTAVALLTAATAGAAPELTDPRVTSAISEELLEDHAVDGNDVTVSTSDGVVTLTGSVNTILKKDRAEKIAESIRGVRSVINRLSVTPQLRSDAEIRGDVKNALLFDRATESYEINATVNDQIVTLTGTVDSWQEKQLAEKIVKGVRGVEAIVNSIGLEYDIDRPDAELRQEIEEALHWNTLVDDGLIEVKVSQGEVTLAGTVGSAAEKRKARNVAWVTGVRSVDVSDLTVAGWARDPDLRRDKYESRPDGAIESAVEAAMVNDPRVSAFEISANVDNGTVTLTGEVDHVQARRAAASNARNTVGVWRVKNQIRIRSQRMSDDEIAQDINVALLRHPDVDRYDITVSVDDGQALLTGTVDTLFEKSIADKLASTTLGVTEVNNNLVVDDSFAIWTYDPYLDDAYLYDYDWYTGTSATTAQARDWEILEEINDELWWSPFVDHEEVTVTVEDGVATLTGTVDTWDEWQAAEKNAFDGGAVAVDNDLLVNFGPDFYNPG